MLISVLAATAAGGTFAAAGVVQQRVARTRPQQESLSPLLLDLVRRPAWLAGIGLALLSYGFQSIALAFGPLALVQPLIATEVLFAVPISVRLHGMRLGWREWSGAFAVTTGLALGIAAARPRGGDPLAPIGRWGFALGVVGFLVVAALVVGRRREGSLRASLYAFAAAGVFALQSSFLAAAIAQFQEGLPVPFGSWQLYAMVAASIAGLLLVQSAFQAGPLAASMPVVDAAEPTVAIGLGVALFGERVNTGAPALAATAAGMLVLLVGIATLDTSPVVRALQEDPSARREPREDVRLDTADRVEAG